ncbi:5'(3')-deoxyribonucleotidase [Pedobacter sp. N36a]|uniref:5' nucleotidase, NT5C type n=1 Tax=Pedobacter sp. N36a TaxID=2767996 RepID=UPI001656F54D|nr:5'(3')-deoxyribonucleotidase [Pedobacter sp. N36a]MBC8985133.1 5'(3')-deoxyribonucleotidase [Pedobacter sp. N36a]
MNEIKKTIGIDMDGVLADIEEQFMDWYEKEYGVRVPRSERLGVLEPEGFPEKGAIRRYVNTPGFFRTIPLMDGAVAAVKKLMEDYEVYIVSAAMEFPQCLSEKQEWLAEHFSFISWRNIIFCGDKSVVVTDYLIDDHCKNLDFCKGKAIMFDASHNVNQHHHVRVKSWTEILAFFEQEKLGQAHLVNAETA